MSDLFSELASIATTDGADRELPYNLQLDLVVHDRDVIRSLVDYREGDERNQFALEALKIGVLALRHVGGQATADLIQREVRGMQHSLEQHSNSVQRQLSATLKEYFDPRDGRFSQRVQGLVAKDGELSKLICNHVDGDNSQLSRTLLAHVGADSPLMKQLDPQQSDGLLAVLKQTVDSQLAQQRDKVLSEFSLDNKNGALARLVGELTTKHGDLTNNLREKIDEVIKEFSLDKEDSALSRLVGNVDRAQRTITNEFSLDNKESAIARLKNELTTILSAHVKTNAEFQEEVKGALRELTARREEQARSTLHGGTFQSAVFEFLHRQCEPCGDIAELTGDQVGAIKNRKWGDVVVTLGPDSAAPGACVVFEAKEDKDYTLKSALKEIENARKNRMAQVGVFVFSKKTFPAALRPLSRYGNDVIVVWDADDAYSDAYLLASLELARAICFHCQRRQDSEVADFDSIEKCMLDIEKHANNLDEIHKSAITIRNSNDNILKRVEIDKDALTKYISQLRQNLADIRGELLREE